ncbi:HD domain-containing protein [Roseateles sp. DAIF2]|uniref:phosphonate degradation HD-domain oxygenase n=1 Tax=Roseateles sp. DAIF2 TaxID=2714952 RepID=UPI0018A2E741|nr:phosphonate degradation HD-domain oxygenase [Roseateles sp. DAIF2]QPF74630.1 HD domain-containing protein [Roseateles sp. DAIF2]
MALTLDQIETLLRTRGHASYSGEPVTQLEHALQSALLAEQEGADAELITAALLHDLGHLLDEAAPDTPTLRGIDDLHQYRLIPFLRGLFPPRVLQAIAGHVDAKRWLCAERPGYHDSLSADSRRSLRLQGGIFTPGQAAAFIARPYAQEALRLRLWDDLAKQPALPTPPLDHYLAIARGCALAGAAR